MIEHRGWKGGDIFERFVENGHRILFDAGAIESNRVHPEAETRP
jgi:hypothetical protein